MRPKMTRKKCQNGCVGGSFVPRHVDSYTSMFSRFWGGMFFGAVATMFFAEPTT